MSKWKTVHEQPVTGLDSFTHQSVMNFRLVLIGGQGSKTPIIELRYLDENHLAYPLTHGNRDEPITGPLAGLLEIAREVLDTLPKSPHGYGTHCKCGSACEITPPTSPR